MEPKTYSINEIFYSIQGEGRNSGTPATFVRFHGCNLSCDYCDTKYAVEGSAKHLYTAEEIHSHLDDFSTSYIVFTGGEPLLQLDMELLSLIHGDGFTVAIETNGTLLINPDMRKYIDWLTVSPKKQGEFVQRSGDELKIIYPDEMRDDVRFAEDLDFDFYYVQPRWDEINECNDSLQDAVSFCLENPKWRLSTQLQKTIRVR